MARQRPRRNTRLSKILRHLTIENARSVVEALWRIFLPLYTISVFRESSWVAVYTLLFAFRSYYAWKLNRVYTEHLRLVRLSEDITSSLFKDHQQMEAFEKSKSMNCWTDILLLFPQAAIEPMYYQMVVTAFTMNSFFTQVADIEDMARYLKKEMRHMERDAKYCRENMKEKYEELFNDEDGWDCVRIQESDLLSDLVRPAAPDGEQPETLKDTGNMPAVCYMVTCFGVLYLTSNYPDKVDLKSIYTPTYLFFIGNQILQLRTLFVEHLNLGPRLKQVEEDVSEAINIYGDLASNY